jgi:hypothetical protein
MSISVEEKESVAKLIGNGKASKVLKEIQDQNWFTDHLITLGTYEKVVWQKPGTSMYKVVYLIDNNRLFVYGDIGDAVYSWSECITWKFLHDMCFSYFHSKCRASETGLPWLDWCTETCMKDLREAVKQGRLDEAVLYECANYADSEQTWRRFVLEEMANSIQPEELLSFGSAPALRCVGHWYGLQLVTYRLKKDNNTLYNW